MAALFSFKMQLSGVDLDRDNFEDKFYGASCDDALISVVDGKLFLDFDREAPSFKDAVSSAKSDVERAGARVVAINSLPPPLLGELSGISGWFLNALAHTGRAGCSFAVRAIGSYLSPK